MNDLYIINKNYEKVITGNFTYFLDFKLQILVKRKLGKVKYNVYKSYIDSDKVIFYQDKIPNVLLYEIVSKSTLKHQEIMGTLFSLGIDSSMYGDILIIDNHYYIYILDIIEKYLLGNLIMINSSRVELKKIDKNYLQDYTRKYECLELIVSSERIDTVVSSLVRCNREKVINKIKEKEVLVNYDVPKVSYKLKTGDIISVRKYGKYKYNGIIKKSKKGNFIVSIDKYI